MNAIPGNDININLELKYVKSNTLNEWYPFVCLIVFLKEAFAHSSRGGRYAATGSAGSYSCQGTSYFFLNCIYASLSVRE
jgi:hypothetical protein